MTIPDSQGDKDRQDLGAPTKPIGMESNDHQNSGKEKIVVNHHRFHQMISLHAIGRRTSVRII